jgi:hypothetical protein
MERHKRKSKGINSKGASAKSSVRNTQARKFRNLLAAEELIQAAIETLVSLGAGEFTPGLSAEHDRILAKLETMHDGLYSVLADTVTAAAQRKAA